MSESAVHSAITLPLRRMRRPLRGVDSATASIVLADDWLLAFELAFGVEIDNEFAHAYGQSPCPLFIVMGDIAQARLNAYIEQFAVKRPEILDWKIRRARPAAFCRPCPIDELSVSIPYLCPEPRAVVVLASMTDIALAATRDLVMKLRRLSAAANARGFALLMIFCRESDRADTSEFEMQLMRCRHSLAGFAHLKLQEKSPCWQVYFWNCLNHFAGSSRTLLSAPETDAIGFTCIDTDNETSVSLEDENEIFSASARLTAVSTGMSTLVNVSTNAELYKLALNANAATIVFSLSRPSDISEVGRYIYTLRKTRGRRLKIAAVADGLPLRVNSLAFILSCGANRIFELSASAEYIGLILSALKDVVYPHDVTFDFEEALKPIVALHEKGIVGRERFLEVCHTLISQRTSKLPTQGILVSLTPRRGLSAEECASQFEPQRSGDIGCVSGDNMLLFLFGCQPSHLKLALTRNFLVDPSELFEKIRTENDDLGILAFLRSLKINTAKSGKKEQPEGNVTMLADINKEIVPGKQKQSVIGPNAIEPQALDDDFLRY